MNPFVVIFVTKRDCPLCARAAPLVDRWARRLGGRVETVSIETAPELGEAYATRLPVVLGPDRQVITEGRLSSAAVAISLTRARLAQIIRR